MAWKAQAFLANAGTPENSAGYRETPTSGPACDLPLISEFFRWKIYHLRLKTSV